MRWFLIGWMIANAVLIVVGLVTIYGPGPADHRVGGAFPLFIGSLSSAAWLFVLIIWLLVFA